MNTPVAISLEQAKEDTFNKSVDGTTCPCCQQFVKVYRRKITSSMARALIELNRHGIRIGTHTGWTHMPELLARRKLQRSDEAKLVHWGLMEPFRALRDDGSKRNGMYRITYLGHKFVQGALEVPKYVYIYNHSVQGFSDGTNGHPNETVSIQECIGEKFNYRELMEMQDD